MSKSMQVKPLDLNSALVDAIDWHDPIQLGESLPVVPTFDMRILPKMVGRYASDIAERMGCPVDFPVVATVIAMATAIGSSATIKPYDKGTWYVPANLWGMCVSPPSAIKSPPILEALRALKTMDRLAADKYAKDARDYDILYANYDSNVKKLVKTDPQAALALAAPEEPKMNRYIVNDSTYEMLIAIAAANPQGFLIWRDELIGWFHSLSKENQKEARGLYLTGWSGSDGYATDRIGRGHVRADKVCFSLLGTIQPNVLRTIVQDAVSGGAGDDGLMARFQLAVYPNPVTEWHKVDRHMDIEAATHYEDLLARLASLDPKTIGAQIALDGTVYLEFDDEAMML